MAFIENMLSLKTELEQANYNVDTPIAGESSLSYDDCDDPANIKSQFIQKHLDKIKKSDAILVVNEAKKGIDNYVGANSFLEMGFAFAFNKKIYLLNDLPDTQDNVLEISGMKPICLKGNIQVLLQQEK